MQDSRSKLYKEVLDRALAAQDLVVSLRRQLHATPEIGFELHQTSKIIEEALSKLPLKLKTAVGKTGILAELIIDEKLPWVALRADMDALPMNENSGETFTSKNPGAAHMCGHDAHSAMLVGAAHVLTQMKGQLKRNVRFIFQPSEEALPGGAPAMIDGGALIGVEEVFGIHVWPLLASGKIGICQGPAMAQPDTFEIEIFGSGGHAAVPQLCVDPIIVAAQLIQTLQTLVSRNSDPLKSVVVSVTKVHGGTADNVIPERVTLGGTIRTFESSVQVATERRFREIVESLPKVFGARAELIYHQGYPPLINDLRVGERCAKLAADFLGQSEVVYPADPVMGGEDFAFYTKQKPGVFVFLGNFDEAVGAKFMCHDPRFKVDERIFSRGVSLHSLFALSL